MYVIEYQKRGLPHAHILLKFDSGSSPTAAHQYDKFVSAEIPDKSVNKELHKAVTTHMMHGPCGFRKARCYDKDAPFKCSKGFPKPYCEETKTDKSGYPTMLRRNDGRSTMRQGKSLTNQYVVPYNPYLLYKYNCHINVEICSSIQSVKYLYKYIYKGSDRARLTEDQDEIKSFLDGRYVSNIEACWKIFDFKMHGRSHTVVNLDVHLENRQFIYFKSDTNVSSIEDQYRTTKLIEFFKLCSTINSKASTLLYHEMPQHYTWKGKFWQARQRSGEKAIGRLISCSPLDSERYYLRLLLCYTIGPKGFKDIRTINGVTYLSYKDACKAAGYLEDDSEWNRCLQEASLYQMPSQLRQLFATILIYCQPGNVEELWNTHLNFMSEDFQKKFNLSHTHAKVIVGVLNELNDILINNKKSLADFPNLPQFNDYPEISNNSHENRLLREETNYNLDELNNILQKNSLLNIEQRQIYDRVVTSVIRETGECYFLDGPGGTGKSFLLEQILANVRSNGNVALAVASSGIAALLLTGGKTVHSRFRLPLNIDESSMCTISKQTNLAELLKEAKIIIWDEAPMSHRFALEAINRTMQDLMDCSSVFGGKTLLLSGDFRQILPVIPRGSISQIVDSCISKSELWRHFTVLKLTRNMRLQYTFPQFDFPKFLIQIGDGKHLTHKLLEPEYFKMPHEFIIPTTKDSEKNRRSLIDFVYGDIKSQYNTNKYFSDRVILAPLCAIVNSLNSLIMKELPGPATVYRSIDSIEETDGLDQSLHQIELLNSLNPNGMPPHLLELKVGSPLIVIRNLNDGLCNGTRIQVCRLSPSCIDAQVLTGPKAGSRVFIPRISLIYDDPILPFKLKRRQFPVNIAFAMTINKSQGQTLKKVGVYLDEPVFSHGHMYVAMSRCSDPREMRFVINEPKRDRNGIYTKNVVYKLT